MVPNGWREKTLDEFAVKVLDGDRGREYPSSSDFFKEEYCLFLTAKNVTKNGFRFNETQFITKEKDEALRKGKLKRQDIVLTTRGTVGNFAFYNDSVSVGHIRINSGMVVLRNTNIEIDNRFLFMLMRSPLMSRAIRKISFGSAQPQLTVKGIKRLKLSLPPYQEQIKIAGIISSWDQAIGATEKLIDNSERQKKALMQQLLTGKKRLKGFSGDWETVPLTSICKVETGSSNREDSSEQGEYTFFDRSTDIRRSDRYLFDTEAIIVGGEGQDFIPKYFSGKFDLHQRAYCIHAFDGFSARYVYHAINYKRHLLKRFSVGSTVASLRMGTFTKIPLRNIAIEEQVAIASALDSSDDEIIKLTKKRDYLKQEKSALMQQLLTGKRRVKIDGEIAA